MDSKKGILAFLILTFVLTWPFEVRMLVQGVSLAGPVPPYALAVLGAVMFVPGVAAFIVRKFITKEGFDDAGLGIGPARYYLVAWLLPVGLSVLACLLSVLLTPAHFDFTLSEAMKAAVQRAPEKPLPSPQALLLSIFLSALTIGVMINTLFAFGEEFGWRGYLLMRLLPAGRLRAMVLVGVVWGLWHAPVILMGYNYPRHPISGVALMVGFCVLFSIILSWLRLASGSVLVPAVAHASLNGPASAVRIVLRNYDTATSTLMGLVGFVVLGVFIAWLYLSGRLSGQTRLSADLGVHS